MEILFVEDDHDYATLLKSSLVDKGYTVDHVSSVIEAIKLLKLNEYRLIMTDLKMEGFDGFQFIEYIKAFNHRIKVIVLSSSNEDEDVLRGIDLNVDAFLSKSSPLEVIMKRVEHVFTIEKHLKPMKKSLNSLKEQLIINEPSRQVTIKGNEIQLSYYEYEMLVLLVKNKNKTLSRKEFLESIWTDSNVEDLDERTIDSHIKTLRSKTGFRSIVSIRRAGYKWLEN